MYARLLQLARHSLAYGFGSVAAKVIAIMLLPIYVRYLEPRSYGIAEAVLILDLFAAAVFRLGLQNAMMRFYYDPRRDVNESPLSEQERIAGGIRVVQTVFSITLAVIAVGAIVMSVAARPLAAAFLGDADLYKFIWIAAFGMVVSVIYSTITATFRLQKRPQSFLVVSLGNVVVSAGLTLFFVTELKWGVEGLLFGNFFGFLALIPVAWIMQRRMIKIRLDRSLVRPMLRFALPTMPIAIANQALTLIDRTVLAQIEGLSELGIYAVGSRFAQVVLLAVVALQLSWQPFAYSIKDDDEARETYAVATSWFAAIMGFLVTTVAVLASPAVHLLTVSAYYPSQQVVPLLALSAGVYGGYFLVGIGASRVRRTGWHFAVAAAAVITSLIANIILVPIYGFIGAAIAAVLANLALAAGMFYRSQRVFAVPYETGRIVRAVLLTVIAVTAAYLLPEGDGAVSVISRLAVVFVWPIALFATGFLTERERKILSAKWQSRRSRRIHRRDVREGRKFAASDDFAPIFIVGAPRSGSTLLYQAITECLSVGYLANAHCEHLQQPAAFERERRPLEGRQSSSFSSEYGATLQPWEPSECGEYWYRFFPREPQQVDQDFDPQVIEQVRSSVRNFARACGRPVVFKNVVNSVRISALVAALPEARFIVVDRDRGSMAQSIIRAREQHADDGEWWSLRPSGWQEQLSLPVREQVAWQINTTYGEIDRALGNVSSARWLRSNYDELCADPRAEMQRIHSWLADQGVPVSIDYDALPQEFVRPRSTGSLQ